MCIVIDTCAFSLVFGRDNTDFEAVRRWVTNGKGKMVMGGSKYEGELARAARYLVVVKELALQRKVVVLDRDQVDAEEALARRLEPDSDFDDAHLVAIVKVSKCRLVCSTDARADRFIQNRRFYGERGPSIYRNRTHAHLLNDRNIVGACA